MYLAQPLLGHTRQCHEFLSARRVFTESAFVQRETVDLAMRHHYKTQIQITGRKSDPFMATHFSYPTYTSIPKNKKPTLEKAG
jgi:hypothetical protein